MSKKTSERIVVKSGKTGNNQNLFLNHDGSVIVENTETGTKVDVKADGTIKIITE